MRDSYLEVARVVLRARGKPLSAREILYDAQKYDLLPPHLHGATMHKTLQARLSEDILENRFRSFFYRTSPGVFFLRELSNDPNISSKITGEFLAKRRKKSSRRQRVLCAPIDLVRDLDPSNPSVVPFWDIFISENASYVLKEIADTDLSLVQMATFCSVVMDNKILAHQVGAYASDSPNEWRPTILGFKSYVSEFDIDLLNDDLIGVRRNACRELLRYVFLLNELTTDADIMSRMKISGFSIVNNTAAVLITFNADKFPFELRGRRKPLDLNQPQWLSRAYLEGRQLDSLSLAAYRAYSHDDQIL